MTCAVDGCAARGVAKGYCHLHYNRWQRHGDPLIAQRMCPRGASVAERLAILTDRSGGTSACWPFIGGCGSSGYGRVRIAGVTKGVHVWAWEEANGPVPDGLIVRHSCDNRPCANPAHLLLGTHQDNMDDKVSRGRQARHPGERNPLSVLTEADAVAIRAERAAGVPATALADRLGVSASLVYAIAAGKRWKHLQGVGA